MDVADLQRIEHGVAAQAIERRIRQIGIGSAGRNRARARDGLINVWQSQDMNAGLPDLGHR